MRDWDKVKIIIFALPDLSSLYCNIYHNWYIYHYISISIYNYIFVRSEILRSHAVQKQTNQPNIVTLTITVR